MSTILNTDSTGAVTLPAELCRAAGLQPETELVAEIDAGRIVVSPIRPPVWERIVTRANSLPPEALDALPDDLAAQHDHYLYGAPKRSE